MKHRHSDHLGLLYNVFMNVAEQQLECCVSIVMACDFHVLCGVSLFPNIINSTLFMISGFFSYQVGIQNTAEEFVILAGNCCIHNGPFCRFCYTLLQFPFRLGVISTFVTEYAAIVWKENFVCVLLAGSLGSLANLLLLSNWNEYLVCTVVCQWQS